MARALTEPKQQLVAKQAVNKAAAGYPRMLLQLYKHSSVDQAAQGSNALDTVLGGEEDKQILHAVIQQLRGHSDEG